MVVMALAGPAGAQTIAGSNMPPDFYPHPKCEALGKAPGHPVNDPDAMNTYNMKVRAFNQKANAFNLCMKVYVDNAQNDINAIQVMVRSAVAEANAK
jgi:hypothetical protein